MQTKILAIGIIAILLLPNIAIGEEGWSGEIEIGHQYSLEFPGGDFDKNNNLHLFYVEGFWIAKELYRKIKENKIFESYFKWNNTVVIFSERLRDTEILIDSKDNLNLIKLTWDYRIEYRKANSNFDILIYDKEIINPNSKSSEIEAVIDKQDNIFIFYNIFNGENCSIYYMKIDNNGNKLVNSTKIIENADNLIYLAEFSFYLTDMLFKVFIDSTSNFNLFWASYRGIEYAKFDSNLRVLVNRTLIYEFQRDTFYQDIIFMNIFPFNSGTKLIFTKRWRDLSILSSHNGKNTSNSVYYMELDNYGKIKLNATKIFEENNTFTFPSFTLDKHNNLHFLRVINDREIVYTKYNLKGNMLIKNLTIRNYTEIKEFRGKIFIDKNDNLYVVYSFLTTWGFVYYKFFSPSSLISISNLTIPKEIKEGENVKISFEIKSIANYTSLNNLTAKLFVDNVSVSEIEIDLLPKENKTISFNWIAERGEHNITVRVYEKEIGENIFVKERGEEKQFDYFYIIIIIIIAVILFAYIYKKSKK